LPWARGEAGLLVRYNARRTNFHGSACKMPVIRPSALYHRKLAQGLTPDPVQAAVVGKFDQLHKKLSRPRRLLGSWKAPGGIYLHGHVGIGKTFLMDLFFDSLSTERKRRQHFHEFMQDIHHLLKERTGQKDPLARIGESIAADIDVLCLDELFVTDIADGMIIYRLFDSLFNAGVVLLITSNFPVNKLYKDDLQPGIFQPAIELIRANTEQVFLDSAMDYRLVKGNHRQTYFMAGETCFSTLFEELAEAREWQSDPLHVHGRPLLTIRHSNEIAWFTFAELCEGPRSQRDYLHLSKEYRVLLLSDIPRLTGQVDESVVMGIEDGEGISASGRSRKTFSLEDNAIRRFISLVDVLYDNGNHLYLSADVPMDELYQGKALQFEFQRTQSRLTEMQSADYLGRE